MNRFQGTRPGSTRSKTGIGRATAAIVVLLMITGALSAGLVGPASAARSFKVTLKISDSRPDVGQKFTVSGKVTPAAPGKKVVIQGKTAGAGWVTLGRAVLTKRSTYKASLSFPTAVQGKIRVKKARSGGVARGLSFERNLRVGEVTPPPVIATTTLPAASVGAAYSAALRTADRRAGRFAVVAGALPAGLTLAASGAISGTPTTQGAANFTVRFTDSQGRTATRALTLTVGPAAEAPVIATTTLPGGTVTIPYTFTLTTVGNKTGTWSVSAGTLPAGLTLAPSTGVISGTPTTPTTAATSKFTVKFTAATGGSATKELTLVVSPNSPPVITTINLPTGNVGTPYNTPLKTQGDRPGTWEVVSGTLPGGLNLNPTTGIISGTPNAVTPPGTPPTPLFTVRFTQTGGATATAEPILRVLPAGVTEITTTSLPAGEVGEAYGTGGNGFKLVAEGNTAGGTWSVTPALPNLLVLNSTTGEIRGTPTVAGSFPLTFTFTPATGTADTQALPLTINP